MIGAESCSLELLFYWLFYNPATDVVLGSNQLTSKSTHGAQTGIVSTASTCEMGSVERQRLVTS